MLLNEIIMYAYRTVPYYKRMFDDNGIDPKKIHEIDDLSNVPLLFKDTIQRNYTDMISEEFNIDELYRERTSGSTGMPLTILKSRRDRLAANMAMANFRRKYYDITPSVRKCFFYLFSRNESNVEIVPIRKEESLYLNIFTMNSINLPDYYNAFCEFEPEFIFGPPSSLIIFADYIERNKLEIPDSVRCLELAGEYLSTNMSRKLESVFNCSIINHYGSTETYAIAMSCPNGVLHCVSNNTIVEIVDDNGKKVSNGEAGKICVTSLSNKAMPLIRYVLGDRAILSVSDEKCKCGCEGMQIEVLAARETDYISLKDGLTVNSGILYFAVEYVNSKLNNVIIQFQIMQNSLDQMVVCFVVEDMKKSCYIETEFISALNPYGLKNIKWSFVYKEKIEPNLFTGKLKYFINNIPNFTSSKNAPTSNYKVNDVGAL